MSDIKMDPELKAKWIEALRSGNYKHDTGYLKTSEGCHCALGVLVEMAGHEFITYKEAVARGLDHYLDREHKMVYIIDDDNMPWNYEDQYGLGSDALDYIWSKNDSSTANSETIFSELADWIESNVE